MLIMIFDQIGLLHPVEQVTGTFLNPVENAAYQFGHNLSDASAFFNDLHNLRQENENLRNQLEAIKANDAKVAAEASQEDLQQLQAQFLNNPLYKNFIVVSANVLRRDTSGQNQTITISCDETKDNVKRGKPVLSTAGYLVGRIERVNAGQCLVMLITDNSVAVDVTTERFDQDHHKVNIQPAEATAEGAWQSGGQVNVIHFKPDADVQAGDWIFTSGFGGIFPANILVGKLDHVFKQPGQAEQQATLTPIATLDSLQQVWIVISTGV
jgi:rod shape-determining protein MreC